MTWSIANNTTPWLYHPHNIKLCHSILLQRRLHGSRGWEPERLRGTQASASVQCIGCHRLEPVDAPPAGGHPDALWTHQGTPTGQFSMITVVYLCLFVHWIRLSTMIGSWWKTIRDYEEFRDPNVSELTYDNGQSTRDGSQYQLQHG